MGIKKDDYIKGMEYYGSEEAVEVCGWVDSIGSIDGKIYYNIQADDNWGRGKGNDNSRDTRGSCQA